MLDNDYKHNQNILNVLKIAYLSKEIKFIY